MTLKPGDVVFVMHNDNKLSRIIAGAMGSKWSHSALVADVGASYVWLCETSDLEVTAGTFDRYLADPAVSLEVWSHKTMTPEARSATVKGAMAQIGTVYGFLQLLSLGVRRLCMRMGLKFGNLFRQGMVCCAVVLYGLKESVYPTVDPEGMDTEEMYQMIKNSGQFELVLRKNESQ